MNYYYNQIQIIYCLIYSFIILRKFFLVLTRIYDQLLLKLMNLKQFMYLSQNRKTESMITSKLFGWELKLKNKNKIKLPTCIIHRYTWESVIQLYDAKAAQHGRMHHIGDTGRERNQNPSADNCRESENDWNCLKQKMSRANVTLDFQVDYQERIGDI